jgi:glutaredoxin 3
MCGFCGRAIKLLKHKGAELSEIAAGFDRAKRDEMIARSNGMNTFPQIFIGDKHVGGCDELYALEHAGDLDRLLNGG